MPPRSAYIHVPFCRHRCGYCNFTLITGRDDLVDSYLDALELEMSSQLESPQEVDTLFLGGGTPSYLTGEALQRLFAMIQYWLPLAPGGEFSSEMNPLDCVAEQLEEFRAAGVNRASVGGQSFAADKLKILERDHSGEDLEAALARCAKFFPSVSLDLIFASPGETVAQWRSDLQLAMKSPIQHLSTYGLTIERGAAFYSRVARQELTEIDADEQLEMYSHVMDALVAAGWEHYEVSNFSLPGFRCRHNEAYWLGRPWWAFGPGAASYLEASLAGELTDERKVEPSDRIAGNATLNASSNMVRRVNHRSTTTYIRRVLAGQSSVAEREVLSPEQQVRERLVFGLRRLEGVCWGGLEQWWKAPLEPLFQPYLSRYLEQGWLEWSGEHLRLTRAGLVISDALWPDLLCAD
ncbi:radical SAM family heme chaperone HemW [Aureliella helgolandensis]|uniref:Heme chaperone HemW n=1 Tax=Aureliella helgolandensis TaxID=2527968 RepID=A0A518G0H6_9BACT|nr:radical SAM family heme chaperone HemW [Aureliella helgolandensis]QDV22109.1 Oxygen-independent coproporphyrinogen-III oxidase-like protein [Aureliella helgolandensis]